MELLSNKTLMAYCKTLFSLQFHTQLHHQAFKNYMYMMLYPQILRGDLLNKANREHLTVNKLRRAGTFACMIQI